MGWYLKFRYNGECLKYCPDELFITKESVVDLDDSDCLEYGQCPDGYYSNLDNHFCTKCDMTCDKCLTAGPMQCITCAKGYYDPTPRVEEADGNAENAENTENAENAENTENVENAENAENPEPTEPHVCKACHISCNGCNGNSSTNCIKCAYGYVNVGGDCVTCNSACNSCYTLGNKGCESCSFGYYSNPAGTICSACNEACIGCSDNLISSCVNCADGYYRKGNECQPCHEDCKTCVNYNVCLSCHSSNEI